MIDYLLFLVIYQRKIGQKNLPLNLLQMDCIIHSAANTSSLDSFSQLYDVNIKGTLCILDFLKQLDLHQRNLIYISTAGFLFSNQNENTYMQEDSLFFFGLDW